MVDGQVAQVHEVGDAGERAALAGQAQALAQRLLPLDALPLLEVQRQRQDGHQVAPSLAQVDQRVLHVEQRLAVVAGGRLEQRQRRFVVHWQVGRRAVRVRLRDRAALERGPVGRLDRRLGGRRIGQDELGAPGPVHGVRRGDQRHLRQVEQAVDAAQPPVLHVVAVEGVGLQPAARARLDGRVGNEHGIDEQAATEAAQAVAAQLALSRADRVGLADNGRHAHGKVGQPGQRLVHGRQQRGQRLCVQVAAAFRGGRSGRARLAAPSRLHLAVQPGDLGRLCALAVGLDAAQQARLGDGNLAPEAGMAGVEGRFLDGRQSGFAQPQQLVEAQPVDLHQRGQRVGRQGLAGRAQRQQAVSAQLGCRLDQRAVGDQPRLRDPEQHDLAACQSQPQHVARLPRARVRAGHVQPQPIGIGREFTLCDQRLHAIQRQPGHGGRRPRRAAALHGQGAAGKERDRRRRLRIGRGCLAGHREQPLLAILEHQPQQVAHLDGLRRAAGLPEQAAVGLHRERAGRQGRGPQAAGQAQALRPSARRPCVQPCQSRIAGCIQTHQARHAQPRAGRLLARHPHHVAAPAAVLEEGRRRFGQVGPHGARGSRGRFAVPGQRHVAAEDRAVRIHILHGHGRVQRPALGEADERGHVQPRQRQRRRLRGREEVDAGEAGEDGAHGER